MPRRCCPRRRRRCGRRGLSPARGWVASWSRRSPRGSTRRRARGPRRGRRRGWKRRRRSAAGRPACAPGRSLRPGGRCGSSCRGTRAGRVWWRSSTQQRCTSPGRAWRACGAWPRSRAAQDRRGRARTRRSRALRIPSAPPRSSFHSVSVRGFVYTGRYPNVTGRTASTPASEGRVVGASSSSRSNASRRPATRSSGRGRLASRTARGWGSSMYSTCGSISAQRRAIGLVDTSVKSYCSRFVNRTSTNGCNSAGKAAARVRTRDH